MQGVAAGLGLTRFPLMSLVQQADSQLIVSSTNSPKNRYRLHSGGAIAGGEA